MSYYITFYTADLQRDLGPYKDSIQVTLDELQAGTSGFPVAHYRHAEQGFEEHRAAWVTRDGEEWTDFVVWFKDDDDEVEYADDRDARLDYERLAQYEGDNLKENA